jgi:hypothetical protein
MIAPLSASTLPGETAGEVKLRNRIDLEIAVQDLGSISRKLPKVRPTASAPAACLTRPSLRRGCPLVSTIFIQRLRGPKGVIRRVRH